MKINIFEFMDVRSFLSAIYRERKKNEAGFSYTRWSSELGFGNKTLLRLILQGKRQISLKSRMQFQKNLNLSDRENAYFEALVDYAQAKTPSQKSSAGGCLIQLQRQNFVPAVIPVDGGILDDVFGPLVLTAVSSSSKPMTCQEIADFFALDVLRVEKLLESLQKKSLIEEHAGTFKASHNTFRIADYFGNEGLRNFYAHWLQQSVHAIQLPFEERRFRSLQIALSKEEFDEVTKLFNEFAVSILSRLENNALDNRRLYLMNTAFFPVTRIYA